MGSSVARLSAGGNAETTANAVAAQVEEVFPEEEDWSKVHKLVRQRMSRKHQKHYRKDMQVRRLFRIKPNEILQGYHDEAARQHLGPPELLFHGTTPENAERILLTGYEMPTRPGMFGRGIYFAKDPLKSINYAKLAPRSAGITKSLTQSLDSPVTESPSYVSPSSWPVMGGFLQNLFGGERPPNVQLMLINDVYLGKQRTFRRARPSFDAKGLKRSRVLRAAGVQDYNSVRAPGGTLGAVKVTEFVVYREYQAIPKFLIEFEQTGLKLTDS